MNPTQKAQVFETKFQEYYLFLHSREFSGHVPRASDYVEWPLFKFSIIRIAEALEQRLSDDVFQHVVDKLIDIKMNYVFLKSLHSVFHLGTYKIVGNGHLHELTPQSVSGMRSTQSRVFLLSAIIEQILDLLQLTLIGKIVDHKKNKWAKVLGEVKNRTGATVILEGEAESILQFKATFRSSEFHKFSMVRALTAKPEWNHLQTEGEQVGAILARLFTWLTNPAWRPDWVAASEVAEPPRR